MTENNTEKQEKLEQDEQHEVGLYEKLANRTAELLEEGRKTLDEALKKAKDELSKAGDFSSEQLEKAVTYVKRDVNDNAHKATEAVRQAVDPHRMVAGMQSIYARILTSAADTLTDLAEKTEKGLEFKTGEVTSAGCLTCKDCGAEMHLKKTGRIPPCPKCHKTIFRKSY
jgi:NAD-dependent SIR2 family protein deacetylase